MTDGADGEGTEPEERCTKTDAISRLMGVRLASEAAPSGQHIGSAPLAADRMIDDVGRIIPDPEQPRKTFPND